MSVPVMGVVPGGAVANMPATAPSNIVPSWVRGMVEHAAIAAAKGLLSPPVGEG